MPDNAKTLRKEWSEIKDTLEKNDQGCIKKKRKNLGPNLEKFDEALKKFGKLTDEQVSDKENKKVIKLMLKLTEIKDNIRDATKEYKGCISVKHYKTTMNPSTFLEKVDTYIKDQYKDKCGDRYIRLTNNPWISL